ncbi:MAG: hypothetical protein IJI25_02650 [Eubacterium sp.]|jgi:hypothetical protein|nr:hypothetical protein [Eubacterium sp.]
MSIYSAFIYEKHNLSEYRPGWMNSERYDYCEQFSQLTAPSKRFLERLGNLFRS